MLIYGFNKTTLLDYPEHVAATVFTGGCNFRCPFCHNGGLVLESGRPEQIPEEEVRAYLKKRKGILEGVCITGGEPTLQPDLEEFIGQVKALGYLVKLDTNGYRPRVLHRLLEKGCLDYVAMDIKASPEKYALVAGMKAEEGDSPVTFDVERIRESVELLKNSGIPYEFRTTVVRGLHEVADFHEIGSWLAGCRAYFLQAFRESDNILGETLGGTQFFSAFSPAEMTEMAEITGKYIDKVGLRGVE